MKKIKLSKSCLNKSEILAVTKILKKEYLGMGEEVHKFEIELEEIFGKKVVCVSSGTAALQLAIQSLGLKKNDEILVQSLTYVSSFQAITANGLKPISCDVDIQTGTLDLRSLKKKITAKTKAIMPVHYAGNVGALDEIYNIAKRYNLRVIEDAAHAFGTYYKGKLIGSRGDIVCFSFDGIKNITAGEGGCVISSDKNVINKIKDYRLLGVKGDSNLRFKGLREWKPTVNEQGWRYHMSNVMAAIGRSQLSKLNNFRAKKTKLLKYYIDEIKKIPGVEPIFYDIENVLAHIFVIKISNYEIKDKLINFLNQNGIETGIHYYPNHHLSYFSYNKYLKLNNTETLYKQILTLPFHYDLNKKDIKFICQKINFFINK